MSKESDLLKDIDINVIGYADGIKMPLWIYSLDSKEILYRNKASKVMSKFADGLDAYANSFENLVKEEIEKSLGNKCFIVSEVYLNTAFIARKFQIIVNRLSSNHVLITFLEFEPDTENENLQTSLIFCNRKGDILKKSEKAFDHRLGNISNVKDILNEEEGQKLIALIEKACTGEKSEFLVNIKSVLTDVGGLLNVECLGGSDNSDVVTVIISQVFSQSELLAEKSRAELAEEINEILKLEIAEHKKTQRKLENTEYLASTIINSSLNILITFNSKQRITEFNKKAQEITGYTREEILNREIDVVLENTSEVENVISTVNYKGYFEGELLCIKKDGSKFGVFASVSLLKNNVGKVQGYVCSLRDVSELKAWREKVAATEERFTDLFENATDLIQGVDHQGKFIYTNKSWNKLLGYTSEDRDKLKLFDIIASSEKKDFKAHFAKILAGEVTETRIWTLKKKNGEELIVESIDNLKLKDNKPHTVRSVMRDITSARNAENLAREQTAKIEAIIESGNIMFWTVNRDIKLTSFNNEYAKTIFKLYGKTPVLDQGKGEPKDKFANNEHHSFWNKKYKEVFTTGKSLFFQTKTKDLEGKIYFREIYLRPIKTKGKKGGITEVAGAGIDITDKKLTERKISEQTSKIQTIFDSTNHMIWSFDTEGKFTSFNQIFKVKLKERYDIKVALGDNAFDIGSKIKIKLKGGWSEILKKLENGDKVQLELVTKDQYQKTTH